MADGPIPQSKICIKCGEDKPLSEFHVKTRGLYGRRTECSHCRGLLRSSQYHATKHQADRVESLDGEQWRPMPGWEGFYEVSSFGRVRTVYREALQTGNGGKTYLRKKPQKLRKTQPNLDGYLQVSLSVGDRRGMASVARSVCEAFHGKPYSDEEAAHKDGNRLNNRADNLTWKTPTANKYDRVLHGTHGQKLTLDDVREIRRSVTQSHGQLATRFNVSPMTIRKVRSGKTWKVASL